MKKYRPTLQTVADAAGVSLITASRALKNHPAHKPETCARVQKIATEIGYRPNPMVSALMAQIKQTRFQKYTATLGLLHQRMNPISLEQDETLHLYLKGAHERANSLGYKLEEFHVNPSGYTWERLPKVLRARNIPGLIILPHYFHGFRPPMDISPYATVTSGFSLQEPQISRVAPNLFDNIVSALDLAQKHAPGKMGLVCWMPTEERVNHQNIAGYLTWHFKNNLATSIPILQLTDQDKDRCPEKTVAWFKKYKPMNVFSLASAVQSWLLDSTLFSPEKNNFVSLNVMPSDSDVSGIDQNHLAAGFAAIDILNGQLMRNERGVPPNPRMITIRGNWHWAGGPITGF